MSSTFSNFKEETPNYKLIIEGKFSRKCIEIIQKCISTPPDEKLYINGRIVHDPSNSFTSCNKGYQSS